MLKRSDWEKAMLDAATSAYGVTWENYQTAVWLAARANELAQSKYSQSSYNGRR
jgi:hypothetical protein